MSKNAQGNQAPATQAPTDINEMINDRVESMQNNNLMSMISLDIDAVWWFRQFASDIQPSKLSKAAKAFVKATRLDEFENVKHPLDKYVRENSFIDQFNDRVNTDHGHERRERQFEWMLGQIGITKPNRALLMQGVTPYVAMWLRGMVWRENQLHARAVKLGMSYVLPLQEARLDVVDGKEYFTLSQRSDPSQWTELSTSYERADATWTSIIRTFCSKDLKKVGVFSSEINVTRRERRCGDGTGAARVGGMLLAASRSEGSPLYQSSVGVYHWFDGFESTTSYRHVPLLMFPSARTLATFPNAVAKIEGLRERRLKDVLAQMMLSREELCKVQVGAYMNEIKLFVEEHKDQGTANQLCWALADLTQLGWWANINKLFPDDASYLLTLNERLTIDELQDFRWGEADIRDAVSYLWDLEEGRIKSFPRHSEEWSDAKTFDETWAKSAEEFFIYVKPVEADKVLAERKRRRDKEAAEDKKAAERQAKKKSVTKKATKKAGRKQ